MMRLNIFETQKIRAINQKKVGVKRFSHFMHMNDTRSLPDERKGMQRSKRFKKLRKIQSQR